MPLAICSSLSELWHQKSISILMKQAIDDDVDDVDIEGLTKIIWYTRIIKMNTEHA